MLKSVTLLTCLLCISAQRAFGIDLPLSRAADPKGIQDMPLDERDLPKELLNSLRADEIIEEIIVKVDNRKQVVRLNENEFEVKDTSKVREFPANIKETPRRAKFNRFDREEDRQSFLANNLSREELLLLLDNINDLEKTLPVNRQFVRVKKESHEENIEDIARKVVINPSKLPGVLQPDGTRCVKKVILVNETEYDRGMKCQHTLKKKCHTTYITDYKSSPQKKCETTFQKNCHITFRPVPHTEKVKKCHTPFVKVCGDDISGLEVCSTVYEDHCETTYKTYELDQDVPDCKMVEELRCRNETIELLHLPRKDGESKYALKEKCEKWPVQKCTLMNKKVKKVHPETQCKKIPKEVCAPNNCEKKPDKEVCHEEERTLVQNIPEEDCDLEPQEICRMESSLVPRLVPNNNCVQVPKEICVNTKFNPKIVRKPIIKNWCYNPEDLNSLEDD